MLVRQASRASNTLSDWSGNLPSPTSERDQQRRIVVIHEDALPDAGQE